MGKPLYKGNVSKFKDLLDVESYVGHGGQLVSAKITEDGITYTSSGGGGGAITVYLDIASRPISALDGEGALVEDATGDPMVGRNIWGLYLWSQAEWKLTASEEDVLYDTSLSDSTVVPTSVGGISAGTTVGDLRDDSHTDIINKLLFPIVQAWISANRSGFMSGVSSATVEVGVLITPSGSASFNPGSIKNGDGSNGPALVGDASFYEFKLPSGQSDPVAPVPATGNSQAYSFSIGHSIIFGSNKWGCIITYTAGTGFYQDSTGTNASNLDGSRVAGSITVNTSTLTGRRYFWSGFGNLGSAPIDSAGVRALTVKSFMSSSNTGTFFISIPAGTPEVYFYLPVGKTVRVNYEESLDVNVTGDFVVTPIFVEDGGGQNVNYEKWVQETGSYPDIATYRVTVT